MATFKYKVITAKGPFAFETSIAPGDTTRLSQSFQKVFGIIPTSFTPISGYTLNSAGNKVTSFGSPTGGSATGGGGSSAPVARQLSPLDQILKTLSSVNKQIQQVQQSSVTQTQQVPTTLEELQKYREQVGIPGYEQQLEPLQETAKTLGERIKGLPEELKTRFQEFLIPEQFRARKEDVERGGLTDQLQTISDQQSIIEGAISEGEKRVQEAAGLAKGQRQAQLTALNSALKYLYDSRTQLQKQQTSLEKKAKGSGVATRNTIKVNTSKAKGNLLDYYNQLRVNTNITDAALRNLLTSRVNQLSSKYPGSTADIINYRNSLLAKSRKGASGSNWYD